MVHGSIKWGQSIDRIFGVAYCSRTVYQQSGVLRCGATLTVRGYRRSIILKGSSLAVSAAEERAAQEKRQRERLEACLRSTRLAHPLRCTLQEW